MPLNLHRLVKPLGPATALRVQKKLAVHQVTAVIPRLFQGSASAALQSMPSPLVLSSSSALQVQLDASAGQEASAGKWCLEQTATVRPTATMVARWSSGCSGTPRKASGRSSVPSDASSHTVAWPLIWQSHSCSFDCIRGLLSVPIKYCRFSLEIHKRLPANSKSTSTSPVS